MFSHCLYWVKWCGFCVGLYLNWCRGFLDVLSQHPVWVKWCGGFPCWSQYRWEWEWWGVFHWYIIGFFIFKHWIWNEGKQELKSGDCIKRRGNKIGIGFEFYTLCFFWMCKVSSHVKVRVDMEQWGTTLVKKSLCTSQSRNFLHTSVGRFHEVATNCLNTSGTTCKRMGFLLVRMCYWIPYNRFV